MKNLRSISFFFFAIFLVVACSTDSLEFITQSTFKTAYAIEGNAVTYNSTPLQLKGVNTLQTFGLDTSTALNNWNVTIVREFIGNLREQPITGSAIQGADDKWLHPLDQVVAENRKKNIITILCPFGWVNEDGSSFLFTGLNPSEENIYDAYKIKLKAIAEAFKGQHDVWIELWNEPYHWNNENNYTHELWLTDQQDMVANLRNVVGFDNIIVVPGNEQGQSEDAILAKGELLLQNNTNILFDLHAYEKWLKNSTEDEITTRINTLQEQNFAISFGEVGVINVDDLMDPLPFLNAVEATKTSTLAWVWNKNSEDQNALRADDGAANNNNNNNWGSTFSAFLQQ